MADFHPIAVHFPVAFLTVYALAQLATLHPRVQKIAWWPPLVKFLLVVGTLGTVGAFVTGKLIELRMGGDAGRLMETHGAFGFYTLVGSLAVTAATFHPRLRTRVPEWLMHAFAAVLLTLVTITGALGGALAYGTEADPIVSVVYRFLIGN